MRGPHSVFFTLAHANHLHVKGGVPEHHDSGLLPALRTSPSGLPTASRPGIPAIAETSPRAGTRGRRASASSQICRNTLQDKAQSQAQPTLR